MKLWIPGVSAFFPDGLPEITMTAKEEARPKRIELKA
jgi:hypothetical protein